MKLYSENKDYKLYQGNMLDMLEVIEPNSIDSIITDPPYELNFMGKGWDNSGIAFQPDTWKQCLEVLKPGGYLLAFGGSRTYHRIACAIEDAGFEIRDTIMWIYGSGFPKSIALDKSIEGKLTLGSANTQVFRKLNGELVDRGNYGYASVAERQGARPSDYNNIEEQRLGKLKPTTELAKKYSGWGTALKPSFEPIIVARKPFKGSLVDNVIEYGVGGINIDECRVGNEEIKTQGGNKFPNLYGNYNEAVESFHNGRFPANTILTYDDTDFDEVCGGFPNTKSNGGKQTTRNFTDYNGGSCNSYMNISNRKIDTGRIDTGYIAPCDSGSASRYFMNCKYTGKDEDFRRYIYTPKASKKDRDEGLDEFEEKKVRVLNATNPNLEQKDDVSARFITVKKNTHPTVKPTELMQYLVRLVSPNGATILDPFNGSGSTGKAVMYENREKDKNYKYIGIELTEEYLPIAKARIEYVCKLNEEELKDMQMSIFDIIGE